MWRKTVVVGLAFLYFGSVSYALDPLGPPKSILDQGDWSFGVEYIYSETDTDPSNVASPIAQPSTQVLFANRVYANVRYGMWEDVDLFVRAGGATFDLDTAFIGGFEGDTDFAWGLGAAGTLYQTDTLDWGLVLQFSSGKSLQRSLAFAGRAEVEIRSLQIAAGPTYQVKDDLTGYAGIFYHMLDGEYEATFAEWDLSEKNFLGGFVGLDWEVKDNARLSIEFQYTGTAFALATGLKWMIR